MYDIIIAGGGPAGLTAAIYAARAGYSTYIIEHMGAGGQAALTSVIENYPGFEKISGQELAIKLSAHAAACGAKMINADITRLELLGNVKKVITGDGTFEAHAVILALGATWRKLGIPGEAEFAGKGVSYCATCDGNFFRGKDVAVVGGGNTALEDATYLARICKKVYLIHRRDTFRAAKSIVDKAEATQNIEILRDFAVNSVEGGQAVEKLNITENKTGKARAVPVSGVFIAVGTTPQTKLLEGIIPLDADGYVSSGEDCVTTLPGIFAAGDIRHKKLRQIITAAADGANAAASAQDYLGHLTDL